jgi:hypothetical protein
VPVTPIIISRPDGFPYTQEATSPSRDRGSATTKTGEDGHRPGLDSLLAEPRTVVLAAGQRGIQIAWPDPA